MDEQQPEQLVVPGGDAPSHVVTDTALSYFEDTPKAYNFPE